LVQSKDLKEKVFSECESLLQCTIKKEQFPGPQPVAIEKKNIPLKERYMVCEKTDGERAILLLLYINNKPMCFIINRNNDFYFTDLSFKKEMFEGSIFDGELIKTKNNGTWHYLIHDTYAYNGRSFTHISHDLRYASIIDFIMKRYVPKETDCFNIKTKIFYKYGPEIEKTWTLINQTTENKIDGLIFTPVNGPIKFGRDNTLLKWKECDNHTIDLLVKIKGKKMYLQYIKQNEFVNYKTFGSTTDNFKKISEFLKANNTSVDPIIEFKIIPEDHFIPYRYRSDKKVPNGEITVFNTLKNIQESIVISDFTDSFNSSVALAAGCAATTDSACPATSSSSGPALATANSACPATSSSSGPALATADSACSALGSGIALATN
jgi:hypothetical protein